ncbi:FtsB family cell division protein [Cohnella thermotolerans]|uniref:FtsB family cell division protein n=1 Tax=Cohnella thermotolerans TaxID=329858 RepID=UPI0004794871|nr:septum formation initiator family protein [Cohnella thermotolerans]
MASQTSTATTPASVGARRRLKLLLIVVVLFMSWAVYTLLLQYHQSNIRTGQLREVKSRLSEIQAKNQSLQQEIDRLNDPEYIGQIARKEQGMGLPGEKPIQVDK